MSANIKEIKPIETSDTERNRVLQELDSRRLELEKKINKFREELEKSTPNGTTTQSRQALSLFQDRIPIVLKNLVGSNLETQDLAHLREQGHAFRFLCTQEMLEKRLVSTELLPHVFNASPSKVMAFLQNHQQNKKIVLTKTCYREGYFSKQLNQFVCFRQWKRVSPLQAAALSLDNFLVLDLLSHIENDEALRLQAAEQLRQILDRKEVTASADSASNASEESCKKAVDAVRTIDAVDAAEPECADLNVYQAPFKELLKAYRNYVTQYDTLESEKNWEASSKLWAGIGECQRRLPTYGLQEFFDRKLFLWPTFTTAPSRGELHYYGGSTLDLDNLGLKPRCAFLKGGGTALAIGSSAKDDDINNKSWSFWGICAEYDAKAIHRLCKDRQAELKHIIACLLKPGANITLRSEKTKEKKIKRPA